MTFKAMQGVDFKNMIFLVFWAKKLTIECAFKTDLAGFYMYPVATPNKYPRKMATIIHYIL
jgi:hypothetical protein